MRVEPDAVAEQLRANDRDRYLATLVLPDKQRSAITALYAFKADIASIRDRAKEAELHRYYRMPPYWGGF